MYQTKLAEKLKEALGAVVPIALIVLVLSLTLVSVPSGTLLTFLFGSMMLIVGMMFFTLGAELSMQPMGSRIGAALTKTRKLPLILTVGFVLGALITVSEPDLQVLAGQVKSIPNMTLILSVGIGVGIFLMIAILHARGTGMHQAERFFGVSLASEKDILFIVARTAEKNKIMQAIMEKAGMNTPAQSIVFSLPVTDTAGLTLVDAYAKEEAEQAKEDAEKTEKTEPPAT